ncbi:MAG: bifunctional UDP-3-O-[3-hydroxymyristoyl] N-acetylglucosamine deacetylase/3-hydroxyacyl-ACP dehydratase [Bacteroidota bacterium]|nr:bifunctional UDP-3-O-[3-hydroxymyristoyl] N-acetylglucosamine deacetylase/3-hydroxyacyl-ACP dehydratase [Bacteroidota bacterium]
MISSDRQHTLAAEATFEGIGLHTGEQAQLRILPGEANSGYVFVRTDLEGAPEIPAHVSNVSETRRGTTLKSGEATIHTTEHVLAALYALGIDNARLELDGPEVPILDGSALPFMEGLESAGSTALDAPRRFFKVRKNLSFRTDDGVEMLIVPLEEDEFKATVMVDYNSPVLGTQHARLENLESFKEDIASCRTFVFLKEVASLAEQGLIKGGDVDNAVVLAERAYSEAELKDIAQTLGRDTLSESAEHPGVVSTSDLRFDNEPARHKLLDIVGDLALTSRFIQGHVLAARPGHAANVAFAKELAKAIKDQEDLPDFRTDRPSLMDINDITAMLPHRYPFLLVDRIMDMDDHSITGVKNVTMNEPFFQGHFPNNPVMPGVLQVEAMAQVGGIFALSTVEDPENYSTYFMKIDGVKFKQKVLPGDTVVFYLTLISPIRRGLVNMKGRAYVRGELVSEAEMLAQIVRDRAPKEDS